MVSCQTATRKYILLKTPFYLSADCPLKSGFSLSIFPSGTRYHFQTVFKFALVISSLHLTQEGDAFVQGTPSTTFITKRLHFQFRSNKIRDVVLLYVIAQMKTKLNELIEESRRVYPVLVLLIIRSAFLNMES